MVGLAFAIALIAVAAPGPQAGTRVSAAGVETATLQVIVTGNGGAVSVSGDQVTQVAPPPGGDECSTDFAREGNGSCYYTAPRGQPVTIAPTGGGTFVGWSAFECSGTGACTVTMDSDRTVVATYTPTLLTVFLGESSLVNPAVTATDGTQTLSCSGSNKDCTQNFPAFASVTLKPAPETESAFDRWSGACQEAGTAKTCTILLSGDDVVGLKYTDSPDDPTLIPGRQDAQLRVRIEPSGAGKVTSSRSRLSESVNCDPTCDAKYEQGEQPTLTAEAAAGSRFVEWRGGSPYCTTDPTCRYPAFRITSIKAVFEVVPQLQLQVAKTGGGGGTVTSEPSGISCGPTCAASFARGTKVALRAQPDSGSRFAGWSGACNGDTCSVTLQAATSVGARFEQIQAGLQVKKTGAGQGTVTSRPSGIVCGPTCTAPFPAGTKVELRGQPSSASRFVGWSGACTGTGICTVVAGETAQVAAVFARVCAARSASGFSAALKQNPRRIVMTIHLEGRASARLRLFRGRQAIATRTLTGLHKGTQTVSLAIPRRAGKGTYRVNLVLIDACGNTRAFTKTTTVSPR